MSSHWYIWELFQEHSFAVSVASHSIRCTQSGAGYDPIHSTFLRAHLSPFLWSANGMRGSPQLQNAKPLIIRGMCSQHHPCPSCPDSAVRALKFYGERKYCASSHRRVHLLPPSSDLDMVQHKHLTYILWTRAVHARGPFAHSHLRTHARSPSSPEINAPLLFLSPLLHRNHFLPRSPEHRALMK